MRLGIPELPLPPGARLFLQLLFRGRLGVAPVPDAVG